MNNKHGEAEMNRNQIQEKMLEVKMMWESGQIFKEEYRRRMAKLSAALHGGNHE
jgi:hypothetical protein